MFKIILQLHGGGSGGGSSSGESKWIPNSYQEKVLGQMTNGSNGGIVGNYISGAGNLFNTAQNMYGGLASTNIDYSTMMNQATGINNNALAGLNQSAQGNVAGYVQNETNALQNVLQNTMGGNLNNWAKNGVVNSSVAASGLNSIAQQTAAQAAGDYNQAAQNQSSNYQAMLQGANSNLNSASTAQNAAQLAASNILTDSLSMLNAGSGVLGTGGSTITNSSSGSSGNWLSGLASVGGALAACFTKDTKIKTPYTEKNIQDIKVGDEVVSVDDNGKEVVCEVLEVQEPVKRKIVEVVAEDENKIKYFVETTMTQPFMKENGDYEVVGNMPLGTKLKNVGHVVAIMEVGEDFVYDLRVSKHNNYIANCFVSYGRL